MNISNLQVVSSYATAWFQQAQEEDVLEQVYQDVILCKQVGQENNDLVQALYSPIIPSHKKCTILQQLFGSSVHQLTLNFFSVVSKKRREAYLLPITEKFLEMYQIYHQITLASITTACKLPADLIDPVKKLIKHWQFCKEVILTEHVNAFILGGFILRVGDQQLDNSLAKKLATLKKELLIMPD